ncbi:MAG: nitroreductase family protein [Clostridia bacterium]|nr:nitroreductase family protein [Clostridia bacterium]
MLDLLLTRRSIRKFQDKKIEKEKVDIIVKSALLSPSSRNRKPWEFVVVTDKELLKKLSRCREHSSQFLEGAPLGIVVIADPEVCDVWIEDTSIAAIIIQLTAHSLGLGSCWVQVRERMHSDSKKAEVYIRELLGISDKYKVECIIGIGYKGEDKEAHDASKLPFDKVHYERF